MEEQERSSALDNAEMISPSDHSPPTDAHDEIGSTTQNFLESEEKKATLAQRLADAFREGVASTKPGYGKRPEVRIPPPAKKNRQESSDAGILDNVIQEGGSAAGVVGDKAASALDSVVQLVKKAPVMTHNYAQAFRDGAASVKPREGRERREELPPSAKRNWSPAGGRAVLDRVFQSVGSAAEIVRGAVAAVKPGELRGARHKICRCNKKINNLYIEIGREAVNSGGAGPVETDKISELLDALRKNEEEIQNLQEHIAEVAAARKMQSTRSQQAAKGAVFTPVSPPAPEHRVDAETAPHGKVSDEADQALPEEPEASQEKTEDTDLLKKDE